MYFRVFRGNLEHDNAIKSQSDIKISIRKLEQPIRSAEES
jgi:hypothetical protein